MQSENGDSDNSAIDEHDMNQHEHVAAEREPQQAIPNHAENQIGMSSQLLMNDSLSMETQALMRILQVHRTVQRHQHGFGSATANNMNEFHQDYSGLVRGVLQVGLVQPSTLAIPGGFEQLQLILFERLRQARIDLELSWPGSSQLVYHTEFSVPQAH